MSTVKMHLEGKMIYIILISVFSFLQAQDIYGCTDEIACNYNPEATIDDGNCLYPEQYCQDIDQDGFGYGDWFNFCPGEEPEGWVQSCSDNCPDMYNPDQTDDDENGVGAACQECCIDGGFQIDCGIWIECNYLSEPFDLEASSDCEQIHLNWEYSFEGSRDSVLLSISNFDPNQGQIEIFLVNSIDIGGFQFNVDTSFPDFNLLSAFGGRAEENGFGLATTEDGQIVGFAFNETIPPGQGPLCYMNIEFTGEQGYFILSSSTISSPDGNPIEHSLGPPYYIGNPDITYNIYRYDQLIMSNIDQTEFTDMNLESGTYYCYYVTATDGFEESLPSNTACDYTPSCDNFGCPDPDALNYHPYGTFWDSCIYAGDVTNDQMVDVSDVLAIIDFILGYDTFSDLQFELADLDFNGTIDILDIIIVVEIILGD